MKCFLYSASSVSTGLMIPLFIRSNVCQIYWVTTATKSLEIQNGVLKQIRDNS